MMLVWIICAVLFCGLIAAIIKIYLLKRSIAEIRKGFSERVLRRHRTIAKAEKM